ncbi:hypothetical protein KEJ43_06395 [Candidatus Bathyarchaeota archaeon]|nr:hypothetical protein [Candidatus Bathyarchaeota archaeon]
MESLKREFLELLDRDTEFRYAVAGYLGLSEILKRLDSLAEEQVRLREEQVRLSEEQVRLREEQTKIWAEIARLREDMIKGFERHDTELAKLREDMNKGFERYDAEIAKLREDMIKGFERHDAEMAKLREDMIKGFERYDAEMAKLREDMIKGFERHDTEIAKLREDFTRAFKGLDTRLSRVERTLEKITLDIEDEARIIIKYRLREMGYEIELGPLILPGVELNIYGVSDDLCVIGEASVRASINLINKIDRGIKKVKSMQPDKLRGKIVRVIYTGLAMPDLIERAEKEGIWILKATGDIIKPRIK